LPPGCHSSATTPIGSKGVQSRGSLGMKQKLPWGSSGAPKEVTLNPDDFSIHISKRQKRTLSEQMQLTYPGNSQPANSSQL